MTGEHHNKFIAAAFLVNGGFYLLMLGFMALVMMLVFFAADSPSGPNSPDGFFIAIIGMVFVIHLLIAIPSFVAAYALLKKRSWARIAAIVASVLASMNVPIGTAACIYALWFFFGSEWESVYSKSNERQQDFLPPLMSRDGATFDSSASRMKGEESYEFRQPPDWR